MKKIFLFVVLVFFVSFAFAEKGNIIVDEELKNKFEALQLQTNDCLVLHLDCRDFCLPITEEQFPSTVSEYLYITAMWNDEICGDDGWGDRN